VVRRLCGQATGYSITALLKPVFFVSDLHLGAGEDAERRARFFRFLDWIREQAAGLYILGDLFEFGFEYRQGLIEPNARIAVEVAALAKSGVPVTLIRGNHDYWLRAHFKSQYGITVGAPPLVREIGGRRFYLAHGDELDRSWENQFSRALFHSPFATFLYSLLPTRFGTRIAGYIARAARQGDESRELSGVLELFARRQVQSGFDVVILGHVHKPVLKQLGPGWYLNTGDWLRHFSYGVYEDGKLRLEYFR
jgi:UDP-2,3-diacylglucosamine hydrolase